MKLGSLFDGIGGFPLAASRHGIEPVWASEIEPFPIEVTRRHFPDMVHLGDITKINGAEIEPVDIISFGSPCQDLSVAGKRAGMDGERSGLFYEAIRIIKEMRDATDGQYPTALVWENVPGALSSNDGDDILAVLDCLNDMGYVVDLNILDAQHMGVPQRRRRVFAVCVTLESLLRKRTSLSGAILTDLVVQLLQNIWGVIQVASAVGHSHLGLGNGIEQSAISLQKKMVLLEKMQEQKPLRKLLTTWAEQVALSGGGELIFSDVTSDTSNQNLTTQKDIEISPLLDQMARVAIGIESIYTLLNSRPGRNSHKAKSFTTSTWTNEITQQTIYIFLQDILSITRLILASTNLQKNYLPGASSLLMLTEECMNYARWASSSFFTEMEWLQRWHDYLDTASCVEKQLERYIGTERAGQILFECESVSGDTAEGSGEGEEVAADIGAGPREPGGPVAYGICSQSSNSMKSPNPDSGIYEANTSRTLDMNGGNPSCNQGGIAVVQPVMPSNGVVSKGNGEAWVTKESHMSLTSGGGQAGQGYPAVLTLTGETIARTLTARADSSPCVDRGQNAVMVAIAFNGDQSATLRAGGTVHVAHPVGYRMTAFGEYADGDKASAMKARDYKDATDLVVAVDCRNMRETEISGTLQAKEQGYSLNYQNPIRTGYAVRRLTPTECERLQGYPDGWTSHGSDTARYKALGNSVAVPVVEWIMRRLMEVTQCNT